MESLVANYANNKPFYTFEDCFATHAGKSIPVLTKDVAACISSDQLRNAVRQVGADVDMLLQKPPATLGALRASSAHRQVLDWCAELHDAIMDAYNLWLRMNELGLLQSGSRELDRKLSLQLYQVANTLGNVSSTYDGVPFAVYATMVEADLFTLLALLLCNGQVPVGLVDLSVMCKRGGLYLQMLSLVKFLTTLEEFRSLLSSKRSVGTNYELSLPEGLRILTEKACRALDYDTGDPKDPIKRMATRLLQTSQAVQELLNSRQVTVGNKTQALSQSPDIASLQLYTPSSKPYGTLPPAIPGTLASAQTKNFGLGTSQLKPYSETSGSTTLGKTERQRLETSGYRNFTPVAAVQVPGGLKPLTANDPAFRNPLFKEPAKQLVDPQRAAWSVPTGYNRASDRLQDLEEKMGSFSIGMPTVARHHSAAGQSAAMNVQPQTSSTSMQPITTQNLPIYPSLGAPSYSPAYSPAYSTPLASGNVPLCITPASQNSVDVRTYSTPATGGNFPPTYQAGSQKETADPRGIISGTSSHSLTLSTYPSSELARVPTADCDNQSLVPYQGTELSEDDTPLVGEKQPLAVMLSRYEDNSPFLCARLLSLEEQFPAFRSICGDGNCFYRALLFAVLERIVSLPDYTLRIRVLSCIEDLWPHVQSLFPWLASEAAEGRQHLKALLDNMWFLDHAMSAEDDSSVDLAAVETALNDQAKDRAIIQLLRLVTSWELRRHRDFYHPFLAGCGPDATNCSIVELCEQHVERMNEEVEQLQVIALIKVIGVSAGILDVAHSEVGYIKHPGSGPAPDIWLIHLPGHYEVVYPNKRYNIDKGLLLE